MSGSPRIPPHSTKLIIQVSGKCQQEGRRLDGSSPCYSQKLKALKVYLKYQNASIWRRLIGRLLLRPHIQLNHWVGNLHGGGTETQKWERQAAGMCPRRNCQVTGCCAHQLSHTDAKNCSTVSITRKDPASFWRNTNLN